MSQHDGRLSDDDPCDTMKGDVERRGFLKAAGLGLAATAGALASGSPAAAQIEKAPLPPIIAPPKLAVPIPTKNAEVVCGTTSTTHLKNNTLEITVPAGRQVIVRELPEAAVPIAEVVVNISRDIVVNTNRAVFYPVIPPGS